MFDLQGFFVYVPFTTAHSEGFLSLTRLNMSSLTGWKRYESGMDKRRPAVIAAQNILAR